MPKNNQDNLLDQCRIIPKKIERFEVRLFEEEIDIAQFLSFYYDLSYEQLLCKLAKEHLEQEIFDNKKYICNDYNSEGYK